MSSGSSTGRRTSPANLLWNCFDAVASPHDAGRGCPADRREPRHAVPATEDNGAVSVHHNLWAHHARRVPCMAPYRENAASDFCNNLIYNCRGGYVDDGHGAAAKSQSTPIGITTTADHRRRIDCTPLLFRRI